MIKKISFLGDILCDSCMANTLDLYKDKTNEKYDFTETFQQLSDIISCSDYVIANLETPLSRNTKNQTHGPWTFNTPYEYAYAMKKAGIDCVSTANNHCLDMGIEGIRETIDILDEIGLQHCGTNYRNKKSYSTINLGELKIGILAYSYGTNAFSNNCYLSFRNRNSVNLLQEQEGAVERIIRKLTKNHYRKIYKKIDNLVYPNNKGMQVYEKETFSLYRKFLIKHDFHKIKQEHVDFVISLLHIGGQYNIVPSLFTKKVSEWFKFNGCDAVICNHEHVIHGFQYSDEKITAYALGNCIACTGIVSPPYDRRCEYSIALHLYVSDIGKIDKITFSVLRAIKTDKGTFEVWPVTSLAKSSKYREMYNKEECLLAAYDFSGIHFESVVQEFEMSIRDGCYGRV